MGAAPTGSKEEAPSTYEVEGASQFRDPTVRSLGPRLCGTRQHRSASLGEHRSTRCPSPQKAPSRGRLARVVDHLRTPRRHRSPLSQASGPPGCPLTLRFPLESGHRLWWRAQISTAAERPAQGAGAGDFKLFCSSTGAVELPPCRGMLSTGCPPVHPQGGSKRPPAGGRSRRSQGCRNLHPQGCRKPGRGSVPAVNTATMGRTASRRP
jgi:hypothetical protein